MEGSGSSMWSHLMLEQPWPVAIAMLVLAGVLWRLSRQRARRKLALASLIAVGLGVGVLLLAWRVTTDRERVLQRTRAMVEATSPFDSQTFERFLAPEVVLTGPDGEVWLRFNPLNRELARAVSSYGIASQRITSIEAWTQGEDWAFSRFELRTLLDNPAMPVRTVWTLRWRRGEASDEPWRVDHVRWLQFQGNRPAFRMWR